METSLCYCQASCEEEELEAARKREEWGGIIVEEWGGISGDDGTTVWVNIRELEVCCALSTLHCVWCSVQCVVCSVQCAVCSV